jgi:penicillin amidase
MPTLNGPNGPVPYQRDRLGYPRIDARSRDEAAWARGWFHAVDRQMQAQIGAYVARGRLMELLGENEMTRAVDRWSRALGLANGVQAQVARLSHDALAMVTAYADGFEAGRVKRGVPLPMRVLGAKQIAWTPEGVLLTYKLLSFFGLTLTHIRSETAVAELIATGAPLRALQVLLGPGAEGLDLDALADLTFAEPLIGLPERGSNVVAVSAARSATGTALLQTDPHLELGATPPAGYAVDCVIGDQIYSGVGIVGWPFLTSGRNAQVAFGYTFAHADNVDVIVERCRNGTYLRGDRWLPFTKRVERVARKGKEPVEWVFWDNPWGVVMEDASGEADLPLLRWSGLDQVHRDIEAFSGMQTTPDVATMVAQHREVRVLSVTGVFADTQGSIGSVVTGQVDTKPAGWTGAVPWPGWTLPDTPPEPLPESTRPMILDPPEGIIVSANEQLVGPLAREWNNLPEPPYRHATISAFMAAIERPQLTDLVAAVYDETDACAARLLPVWAAHLPDNELTAWAGRTPDRHLAAWFHALHHEVVVALLARDLGPDKARRLFDELGLLMPFQAQLDPVLALEHHELLDDAGLSALLAEAWPRSTERLRTSELPIDMRFNDQIEQGKLPAFFGFGTPPVAMPGSPTSPFQARVVHVLGEAFHGGPGWHVAVDLGQPGCWYNVPGGASERRFGPGYGKGWSEWVEGRFLALGGAIGGAPDLLDGRHD